MRTRLAAIALLWSCFAYAQTIDVASVKPNARCESSGGRGNITPNRLDLPCQSLRTLVWSAYGAFSGGTMSSRRIEVIGGPAWIDSERFDISVKSEGEARVAQMVGAILRKLLEERFQLKVHKEAKDSPVYELSVAKSGPKMQEAKEGSCVPIDLDELSRNGGLNNRLTGEEAPKYCGAGTNQLRDGKWTLDWHGVTMPELAGRMLAPHVDRPIIDRTNISGRFDVHLELAPADLAAGPVRLNGVETTLPLPADTPNGLSIFAALQEQLGLKLTPARGPVEVIVIDRIERPSAN
jgi:uncharacterized protein (TIGR03435 family)